jgi:hypothetical protein
MKHFKLLALAILIAIFVLIIRGQVRSMDPPSSSFNSGGSSESEDVPRLVLDDEEPSPDHPSDRDSEQNAATTAASPIVRSTAALDVKQLYECGDVPRSETELQERLDVLREMERRDGRDYQKRIFEVVQKYERCVAVPLETRRSRTEILALSADSGDDEEKLKFVNEGMPSESDAESMALYQEKARGYLDVLLGKGNAAALRAKAIAYSKGSAYPRDPAKAYSYLFAYAIAEPKDTNVAATLAMVESGIDPRVIDSLRAVGSDLAKCCSKQLVRKQK